MHEMSIAQSLLDIIFQKSRHHQVKLVSSVSLKVGELSAVETESLRFCFQVISEGTIAEGARLDIERVPIRCRCRKCGLEFTVKELSFNCPECEGTAVEMLTGKELNLESFEAE